MDIGKSFTFVFEDKRWLEKVLIGGLITLVVILFSWTIIIGLLGAALLMGYMIEIVRNVRRGDAEPLPEWNGWGEKIVLGIKYLVVLFIWSLPLLIIWLPVGIVSAITGDSNVAWIGGILATCFGCLALVYGVFLALATPPITVRLAEFGQISSGLAFGEIFDFVKKHIGDIIIVMLVVWAVSLFANVVGILLCGIGLLFTGVWSLMVQGHLYGQLGRERGSALQPAGMAPYDLSPETVMPGIGELPEPVQPVAEPMQELGAGLEQAAADVKASADEALGEVQDLASSVQETVGDVAPPVEGDVSPFEPKPDA